MNAAAVLFCLRTHWVAILVVVVAIAFGWQMQMRAWAEAETAAVLVSAADDKAQASEDARVEAEAVVATLREEARRRDLVLAGPRTLRDHDRKELEQALVAAAAAKNTTDDGPLAPVSKEQLRRVRGQQN